MQLVACTGQEGSSDLGSLCQMPWQEPQAVLQESGVCVFVCVCLSVGVCVSVCVC